MARFAKDDMLNELRTIFLFEADHLLLTRGEEFATEFIGFPPGDAGEYCDHDPINVDLSLFHEIKDQLSRAYDYVFNPSRIIQYGTDELQDIIVFMLGTPRAGGITSGGATHRFMTPDGLCQTVVDAAAARAKLEIDGMGGDFTIRELALLANMTEGAVRNALADKGPNGLQAIPGAKPVRVAYDDAHRWLHSRRGFVPTPARMQADRLIEDSLRAADRVEALSGLIARIIRVGGDDAFAHRSGISDETIEPWLDGTFRFDQEAAIALAKALDLDVPLFVGKALELSMRRDVGGGS